MSGSVRESRTRYLCHTPLPKYGEVNVCSAILHDQIRVSYWYQTFCIVSRTILKLNHHMFKVHFMLEPFAALNMSVAFQKQVSEES